MAARQILVWTEQASESQTLFVPGVRSEPKAVSAWVQVYVQVSVQVSVMKGLLLAVN
jgi:hypothetical protein